MKPLKVAIDGCGDLGMRTILPHLSLPDVRSHINVVAVCDRDPRRLAQARAEFGVTAGYDSIDDLLDKSDAEAVLVTVPAAIHADHALRAIRSGRHVYVQKPMAHTVAEADSLIAAAATTSVHIVAAPGQGLWPLFELVRTRIADGAIGVPYVAYAPLMGWDGYQVHHPTDPTWCFAAGCGPFRDHGVYGLHTLTTLLGPVARLTALSRCVTDTRLWKGKTLPVTEDDLTTVLLAFESGAQGVLSEAWIASYGPATAFRILGLEGTIQGSDTFAGHPAIFPLSATIDRRGVPMETLTIDPAQVPFLTGGHLELPNPHLWADIRHLAECVRGEVAPRADATLARHTVDILESAFLAARTGTTISLTTRF